VFRPSKYASMASEVLGASGMVDFLPPFRVILRTRCPRSVSRSVA
jgi:hypothetical protein